MVVVSSITHFIQSEMVIENHAIFLVIAHLSDAPPLTCVGIYASYQILTQKTNLSVSSWPLVCGIKLQFHTKFRTLVVEYRVVNNYRLIALQPCWYQNKRKFAHIVCIKMEVKLPEEKNLIVQE